MEKETYDLEEILSEVRKRREENSAASPNSKKTSDTQKPVPEENSKQEIEKTEEKIFDSVVERSAQSLNISKKETAVEAEVTVQSPAKEENKEEVTVQTSQEDSEAPVTEQLSKEQTEISEDMIDLFSMTDTEKEQEDEYIEQPEKVKFFKTKQGKIVKTIIIVLLILVIITAVGGGIYIYKRVNAITQPQTSNSTQQEEWSGMDKLVENFPEIIETEGTELASYQDFAKNWYYNGEPCSSTHILNVLLLGEDTRGKNILEEGTRADSAIIVSINIDTNQITLTSVLRDAYAYWETTPGDESTGVFDKLNGAMNIDGGDINTYINAVERLYKVNIDNYVIVNFESFEKIIDAMGGVTLELTSSEIYEINNHPRVYGDVYIEKTFEGNEGKMQLTGEQALAYCRIRHIDGDQFRADRQKNTLMAIFKKAKKENLSTLIKMIDALLPYTKTGFSTKNIFSIAKYAFSEGWLDYDLRMTSVPHARLDEIDDDSHYGMWVWRPDYVQDSNYLQMLIYGKSNIILAQTRPDVAKCESFGLMSEGSYPMTAFVYNESYKVPTTYKEMTTEEETSSKASN